ncbi:hypothetical protein Fot_44700 [Forsythia ovata]|uniref:Uncharacterized protein n=1 Tax=Forsythia ovata TaxID=205694 RepID=A0ABD1R580_9LAMI
MPKATVDIFSTLPLEESLLPSENVRQSDKGNRVINDEREKSMPKGAWRMKTAWGISRRPSKVGRLLFEELEKTLSILEVQLKHPFLISTIGLSASILGLVRMN